MAVPHHRQFGSSKQRQQNALRPPPTDAYKLLVSTVVPRPIALATTIDGECRVNAAPFSFFNAVSSAPPVVVLGINPGAASKDGYEDTERNIRDSGSSCSTSSMKPARSG